MQGMTTDRSIIKGVLLCIVVNNGVFDQLKSQEEHSTLMTKSKLICTTHSPQHQLAVRMTFILND